MKLPTASINKNIFHDGFNTCSTYMWPHLRQEYYCSVEADKSLLIRKSDIILVPCDTIISQWASLNIYSRHCSVLGQYTSLTEKTAGLTLMLSIRQQGVISSIYASGRQDADIISMYGIPHTNIYEYNKCRCIEKTGTSAYILKSF